MTTREQELEARLRDMTDDRDAQRERGDRLEAALRDLVRAASEVTAETSIDSDGQGYVWGGHVRTLVEVVRLAEAVLDDGLPDTMAPPGKEADTLPPDAPGDVETAKAAVAAMTWPKGDPDWQERVRKAIDEKGVK